MDADIRKRMAWIRLYDRVGVAGVVCRRCGVSRPTLRKWLRRYERGGLEALVSRSRRPHSHPGSRIDRQIEATIVDMRMNRRFGVRRLQCELLRQHDIHLSLASIHKVLVRNELSRLAPNPPWRHHTKRYSRPIPGDRVQVDTCKIGPGRYQFTAVDDCTRYRVLGLYARRQACHTLNFFERVIDEMPFPVQRIQSDRGREFMAAEVQHWLAEHCIKYRPVKPRSPHLNGKVERSQRTDLEEFYATVDLDAGLEERLAEWQHYYNWERPHGSLGGRSPMDRYFELSDRTPFWEDVEQNYDRTKERYRYPVYLIDQAIVDVKRCP